MTYKSVKNESVYHSVTYFIRHDFGKFLDEKQFANIKLLSRGRLSNTYLSLDQQTTLYQFITPDLDGQEDEVPLSTLYYNRQEEQFVLYIEEMTVNRNHRPYENGTYFRVITPTHVVEIFRYVNWSVPNYTMAVTNRRSGKDLGEVYLDLPYSVAFVHYL